MIWFRVEVELPTYKSIKYPSDQESEFSSSLDKNNNQKEIHHSEDQEIPETQLFFSSSIKYPREEESESVWYPSENIQKTHKINK